MEKAVIEEPDKSTSKVPKLDSVQDFLFGAALYAEYDTGSENEGAYRLFVGPLAVDGHCPGCKRQSTFHRTAGEVSILAITDVTDSQEAFLFKLGCA